jgi:hypothetical protein
MKHLILTLTILLPLFTLARVITVNNNAGSPSTFSSLQAAIATAATGDTIYVQGSATDYGNISITKRLVLLGAGYRPINPTRYLPS